jgi:hypothetical protein
VSLNIEQFGNDIALLFTDAAKEMYTDAQDQWDADKTFFADVGKKYKEAAQVYLQAKLENNTTLAQQMETAMKQYTGAIRATVSTRALQLDAAAKDRLSSILFGIGKTLGTLLGGALLGAL